MNNKPLSTKKYFINNLNKSIGMILALGLSIFLVLTSQMIFYSVVEGPRLGSAFTDYSTVVYPGENGSLDIEFHNQLEGRAEVERILNIYESNTDYYHFFGAANIKMFYIDGNDLEYLMEKLDLKLQEGRMPVPGENEILMDSRIARNKNLKVGDYFGKDVNSREKVFGKYQVVGIIKGPCLFGVCSLESNEIPDNSELLVFPKEGKLNDLNQWLKEIPPDKAQFWTEEDAEQSYIESVDVINKISGIAFVGILFVIAFAVGNTCYSQYYSRRYEFGLLQAIGYTKSQILIKAAKEILYLNMLGFAGGVIIGVIFGLVLNQILFVPRGYPFMLLELTSLLKALIIPFSTLISGLIPTGLLLSGLEPMIVIEKFE